MDLAIKCVGLSDVFLQNDLGRIQMAAECNYRVSCKTCMTGPGRKRKYSLTCQPIPGRESIV